MKNLFILVFMAGHLASAQEVLNRCIQSYMPGASTRFDVKADQVGGEQTLVFRNGSHFGSEELHVYYKGKFWKAALEVNEDFYKKKTVQLNLGSDKLCLKRNFRTLLSDNSHLSSFSESSCDHTETLVMQEEHSDQHPNSQDILTYKLNRDVSFHAEIAAGREPISSDLEQRRFHFDHLTHWETGDCAQTQNSTVQDAITLRNEAVQSFTQFQMSQSQAPN